MAVCGRDARSGGCTENDFFGISMDYILIALVLLLGLVIASVFWVRQREAILFEIGLRNIPRRRAQSALMVLLSTVIFAAAFSTGDTVTCSITQDTFQKLGRVDIIVQAGSNPRTIALEDEQIALVGRVENLDIANLVAEFNGDPDVDGNSACDPLPCANFDVRPGRSAD